MDFNDIRSLYMLMLYVYLKSYEEAIEDFEAAIRDVGYPDEALMAVRQKHEEMMNKVIEEISN